MSTVGFQKTLNIEVISRAMMITLKENLNAQLVADKATWDAQDNAFWTAMGMTVKTVSVDPIPDGGWHCGFIPSVLLTAKENFPMVSVFLSTLGAQPNTDDHAESKRNTVVCEVFVKSEVDIDDVYSKCVRTADAAHRLILNDRTLRGTVDRFFDEPTRGLISESYRGAPESEPGSGVDLGWYWQGMRLEYEIRRKTRV